MVISSNCTSATPIGYGLKGLVEAAEHCDAPSMIGAINARIGAVIEGLGANPAIPESLAPATARFWITIKSNSKMIDTNNRSKASLTYV